MLMVSELGQVQGLRKWYSNCPIIFAYFAKLFQSTEIQESHPDPRIPELWPGCLILSFYTILLSYTIPLFRATQKKKLYLYFPVGMERKCGIEGEKRSCGQ